MTLNITKDDVGTVFKDRNGNQFRMIWWNEGAKQPVVVAEIGVLDNIDTFYANGRYFTDFTEQSSCSTDLIARVDPRREYWVNVYRWIKDGDLQTGERIHSSYEAAVEVAISREVCIGPINITDQIEALLEKSK